MLVCEPTILLATILPATAGSVTYAEFGKVLGEEKELHSSFGFPLSLNETSSLGVLQMPIRNPERAERPKGRCVEPAPDCFNTNLVASLKVEIQCNGQQQDVSVAALPGSPRQTLMYSSRPGGQRSELGMTVKVCRLVAWLRCF